MPSVIHCIYADSSQLQVYSPFLRSWLPHLTDGSDPIACAPAVKPNGSSVRQHPTFGNLFNCPVPEAVEGFELDKVDVDTLHTCWPAGEAAAKEVCTKKVRSLELLA